MRPNTHPSETALAGRVGARAAPVPRTHMLCALAPRVARVIANRVVFAAVGLGRGVLRARSPHASSARFCAPTARVWSVAPLLTCAAAAGPSPSLSRRCGPRRHRHACARCTPRLPLPLPFALLFAAAASGASGIGYTAGAFGQFERHALLRVLRVIYCSRVTFAGDVTPAPMPTRPHDAYTRVGSSA